MPLPPGTRLGPYEILAPLGAGGMGEVYRARDPKLGREVAVKVLAAEFSSNAERLRRFEQEARSASALNHPNIITIYDIGQADSASYIVMELVEGKTLRELLASGPLPLKKILHIAAQSADGLAKAHAAGIVHRDLKPENLMVNRDGFVKILDFGLAKLLPGPSEHGSNVPTMASLASQPGTILGTVGYMSPEQARGEPADFRSDQFSLGAVVYEMAAGKAPFRRESAPQTLAAIIEDEPQPIAELNARVPTQLRWLVERCLAKEPEDRYASTRDLARDLASIRDHLSEARSSAAELVAAPPKLRARTLRPLLWAALGLLAGAGLGFFLFRSAAPEPPSMRALTFSGRDASPTVSPDGRTVAFASQRDGVSRIWLKQLAGEGEAPLTSGPDSSPRFSPDGSSILFVRTTGSAASLYRVGTVGGEPRKLVEEAIAGDWAPDGSQIAFLRLKNEKGKTNSVIGLAAADGGGVREIHTLENRVAVGLRWSPDGRMIAVSTSQFGLGGGNQRFVLMRADGTQVRDIKPTFEGGELSAPTWLPSSDELMYSRAGSAASVGLFNIGSTRVIRQKVESSSAQTLFWIPVRNRTLAILGPGRLVFDALNSRVNLREAALGAQALTPAQRWLTRGTSIDRQPIYSPDGEWLAFSSNKSGNMDLWAISTKTGSLRRLTDHPAEDWDPAFGAGGRQILWSSHRSGHFEIWMAEADGSGAHQVSQDGVDAENPTMTPDGQWIVYHSGSPQKLGLWKIHPDGSGATLLASGLTAWPEVSPDGQFALYTSPEAGLSAVRVVRITDGFSVPLPILAKGQGTGRARWMPGGRAIAFVDKDEKGLTGVFAQDFVPGQDTSATRRPLAGFDPEMQVDSFTISPDGSRIALAAVEESWNLMTADGVPGIPAPRPPR